MSALLKPQPSTKGNDPGSFTIPITIGKFQSASALLDLGVAINVIPTSMIVQLVNRTTRKPEGLLEDILVKVKDLITPADFYVLDTSYK